MKDNLNTLNDWLQFLCTLFAKCALEACLYWIVQQGLWCLRLVWSSGHIREPLCTRSWYSIWNIIPFAYAPLPYSHSFLYKSNFWRLVEMKFTVKFNFLIHVGCLLNANRRALKYDSVNMWFLCYFYSLKCRKTWNRLLIESVMAPPYFAQDCTDHV